MADWHPINKAAFKRAVDQWSKDTLVMKPKAAYEKFRNACAALKSKEGCHG